MSLEQLAPSQRKAFFFIEYLGGLSFEAHSCGNGRFFQGAPSPDLDICFRLDKCQSSLSIHIFKENLIQWLSEIPSLRNDLDGARSDACISMERLLPRYPEMSVKFDQDRREGHSFDALELFVRHFLREGSVFATFGFEHFHKKGTFTDLHVDDILSQNRPMFEDLDLLDEAVDEIDERDTKGPSESLRIVDEPIQSQPLIVIRPHEVMAHRLLAKVTDSRQKLLDVSTTQDATVGVIAFADQVGTSASVWMSGTRAIRDICEGYKTRSLSDIVSALQVVDAMRSVASSLRPGCSKKEFINDVPRWASLLSPDDQSLFFEIAPYLWGVPASTVAYEMADSLTRPLSSLRDIVIYLVTICGLFDYRLFSHGLDNSHRLQTLRHKYIFEMTPTHTISPSSMTTAPHGMTTMGTSMDGAICCEHCNSKFKLGKNGRRGQASNLQKHIKIHHPETIPDYHRVIYNCRYGCGTSDPNKSNIKAHEKNHCTKMKGKQPRRHGKWRQTIT